MSTVAQPANSGLLSMISQRVTLLIQQYEDYSGLTEVRDSQNRVIVAEKLFAEMQDFRRSTQLKLQMTHKRLQDIHTQLDKCTRGDDLYLNLITQEHAIIKEEKALSEQFQQYERAERENFAIFSNAIRDGREREKTYAERTKYWSIIGSVSGAVIGILGTTLSNILKQKETKELREVVKESASVSSTATVELTGKIGEVSETVSTVQNKQNQLTTLMSDIKNLLADETRQLRIIKAEPLSMGTFKTQDEITAALKKHEELLFDDGTRGFKTVVLFENEEKGQKPTIVYVGKEVEQVLKDAQYQLEWKMKINSLATVALIYGGIAVTIPLLYKIFGGP